MTLEEKSRPLLAAYTYFRSAPDDADLTRIALGRQQALVGERLGLRCRVALRQDHGKPYLTWLEVYEGIAAPSLDRMLGEIERAAIDSGLAVLALNGRHREVFESLPAGD